MVFIVNPKNVGKLKCNPTTVATKSKIEKSLENKKNEIQGKGMSELCNKLKKMMVKDSMKNIRITM